MRNLIEALYIFFYCMLIEGTLKMLGLVNEEEETVE